MNPPASGHLGFRDVFGLVQGKQESWTATDGACKLVMHCVGGQLSLVRLMMLFALNS